MRTSAGAAAPLSEALLTQAMMSHRLQSVRRYTRSVPVANGRNHTPLRNSSSEGERLDALQADDAEIRHLMTEVFHLLQPLSVLQREPLRSRVLGRLA